MRVILRILAMVFRRYPKRILVGYISVFGAALFAIAIPRILGSSVNAILSSDERDVQALIYLAMALLFAGFARGLFSFGQTYLGESTSQLVAYDIRNDFFDKLQHLSFGFHDKQLTGALMSRATADVEGVRMFINMGAIRAGFIFAMVVGIAIAMLTTDVKLAAVSLTFVPLLAWRAIVTSRRLRRIWMRVQELQGDLVTVLQENLSGIRVVKAFAAEEYEKDKFRESAQQVADQTFNAERQWAQNFATMDFIFISAIGVILWVGGQDVMAGKTVVDGEVVFTGLTPGDLTAFIFYMSLLTMPVRMTGWMVNNFARAASCGFRLYEILDAASPVAEKASAPPIGGVQGRVAFDNVSFRYDSGGALALNEISLTAEPGQTIALLGRPGSGKSSFVQLIPRFYDVSQGHVTIDGTDVRDVTLDSLRDAVGIVQQDVFIHTTTLRENIAYGAVDAPFERIVEVAKAAQMHDFIVSLPDGYETLVGERGVGLSGGQKQRLSIARTLLRNPPILILDDSTSSVDAQTEHQIQLALAEVIKGRTTFVITHRLSTIANADTVLVFKDGEIVERGTHAELLAREGEYRALYELQLQEDERDSVTREALTPEGGIA